MTAPALGCPERAHCVSAPSGIPTSRGYDDETLAPERSFLGAHEVGMPAKSDPRDESGGSKYFYRRSLTMRELMPAIGVAVGVGFAAFYLARLFAQRTPLLPKDAVVRRRGRNGPVRDG